MSLLYDASLIVTPNAYREGKLYALKPSNGDGDFTFTRATTATRVNSAGLIESVAANVPRVNYPIGGGCPSWLVEPQRTNIVLYSQEFDNAYWSKSNVTISANSIVSPNGTSNADKLIPNASIPSLNGLISRVLSKASTAITYTASIYVKNEGFDTLAFYAFGSSFSNRVTMFITSIDNETFTASSAGAYSIVSAKMINEGNGWKRVILTYTSDTSTINRFVVYQPYLNTGDGINGIGIWQAQLEEGTEATSIIPTTSATVTRNADVITKTGASSLIGQTEGTILLHFERGVTDVTSTFYIFNMYENTATDRISIIQTSGSGRIQIIFEEGNVIMDSPTFFNVPAGTVKLGLSYKADRFIVSLNGAIVRDVAIVFTGWSNCENLVVGSSDGVNLINPQLFINLVNIYKTYTDVAELNSLTTL